MIRVEVQFLVFCYIVLVLCVVVSATTGKWLALIGIFIPFTIWSVLLYISIWREYQYQRKKRGRI